MQDRPLMRWHYIFLFILTLIPLIMTLIVLPFLPDTIALHFDLSGNVNRWGSKYESLLVPLITVATGLSLMWVTKFASKKDDWAGRMMFWVTTGTLILMIAVTAYTLYIFYTNSV